MINRGGGLAARSPRRGPRPGRPARRAARRHGRGESGADPLDVKSRRLLSSPIASIRSYRHRADTRTLWAPDTSFAAGDLDAPGVRHHDHRRLLTGPDYVRTVESGVGVISVILGSEGDRSIPAGRGENRSRGREQRGRAGRRVASLPCQRIRLSRRTIAPARSAGGVAWPNADLRVLLRAVRDGIRSSGPGKDGAQVSILREPRYQPGPFPADGPLVVDPGDEHEGSEEA